MSQVKKSSLVFWIGATTILGTAWYLLKPGPFSNQTLNAVSSVSSSAEPATSHLNLQSATRALTQKRVSPNPVETNNPAPLTPTPAQMQFFDPGAPMNNAEYAVIEPDLQKEQNLPKSILNPDIEPQYNEKTSSVSVPNRIPEMGLNSNPQYQIVDTPPAYVALLTAPADQSESPVYTEILKLPGPVTTFSASRPE